MKINIVHTQLQLYSFKSAIIQTHKMSCFLPQKCYRVKSLYVPVLGTYRSMGGAAKPRRRLTPADCADRINELNAEEQKMMLEILIKHQKKDKNKYKNLIAFNAGEPAATSNQFPETDSTQINGEVLRPTSTQLRQLAIFQAMPFVGFGFLDNFIMIIAGEYIDLTIGATLSISTMAAAALGNTISDVFGIGSAWYVEHWSARLGIHAPPLTLEQMQLTSCRLTANAGRALGVMFGCIIGMVPLLFIENNDEEENTKVTEQKTDETAKS